MRFNVPEAMYTEDLPAYPNEVFGAFVLSTIGSGNIVSIDASAALNYPGVIAFYSAKDIPGLNAFTPNNVVLYTNYEEVLSSGTIMFYNQPIGIIVAEVQQVANIAAKLVKVTYGKVKRPIVHIDEARKDPSRNNLFMTVTAQDRGTNIDRVIKNHAGVYGQCHFLWKRWLASRFQRRRDWKCTRQRNGYQELSR
ncbi:xanthine dehydrogenase/oxidase-like [Manduca sexta]|uniref:xanthine dehydrogenase/oxidase-like n=1 Tax=Manduca sexta TaxID=7130 RepID=UPI00188DE0DD|nr:xanthine dehydrogenase/oxidase-like [Manduca sexta]